MLCYIHKHTHSSCAAQFRYPVRGTKLEFGLRCVVILVCTCGLPGHLCCSTIYWTLNTGWLSIVSTRGSVSHCYTCVSSCYSNITASCSVCNLGQRSLFVCLNDKHRLKVGDPGYPLRSTKRGRRVMVSKGTVFQVGGHNFTKYSSVVFFTEPCAVAYFSALLSNLSLPISTSLIPTDLIWDSVFKHHTHTLAHAHTHETHTHTHILLASAPHYNDQR